ncbi:MAG: DUF1553 domain-containing protein [Cytophagales bacterium]|nr:DUF1553 domain-containing protein [Cytophagales bacterium]
MWAILNILGNKQLTVFSLILLLIVTVLVKVVYVSDKKVDFNTEVRPILNSKCTGCHGGVKKAGGISFIYRSEALGKGESGKQAIVPGDPDHSEFIIRLRHKNHEMRMPLGKPPLTDEEVATLKKWISQGAEWQEHWAFVKPKPQDIPSTLSNWVKNDIDKFILNKLSQISSKLKPNEEADKVTLIRRLYIDILGIPPTLDEVQKFVDDRSDNAYENMVDDVLKRSEYGEKWAAMWLDLARYADSKGYEKDKHREIWRYRDYVIKSFNDNKPYDVFVREQLAGDLMPNPTEEQIIATAFHRNTLTNDEGGTDNEEFRTAAVIDRVNTTFDVFQGVTMGCVQCHSHPYDPIPHQDYYRFMAFMNSTADHDHFDDIPRYIAKEDTPTVKIKRLMYQIDSLTGYKTKNESYETQKRRHMWPRIEAEHVAEAYDIEVTDQYINIKKEGSFVKYKNLNLSSVKAIKVRASSEGGSWAELHIDSPKGKIISQFGVEENFGEWFEYGKDIALTKGIHDLYVVFKKNKDGFCNSSIDYFNFYESKSGYSDTKISAAKFNTSSKGISKNNESIYWEPNNWVIYNNVDVAGSKYIGIEYNVAGGSDIEFRLNDHKGPLLTRTFIENSKGVIDIKYVPITINVDKADICVVFKPDKKGRYDGIIESFDFNIKTKPGSNKSKNDNLIYKLRTELQGYLYHRGIPVLQDLPDNKKRVTKVFHRGNWRDPKDTVMAGTPEILNKMNDNLPKNRLGMAVWLTSQDHPLTARVAVNRFWEQIFGYGIVETLEDFGSQGNKPTHPELLDYLALKFQNDMKWDVKKLLKYYVMSATYRQSSEVSAQHLEIDARNRYLARAPRVRLSAEVVRDQALAVSGLLSKKMYGPSVMPYQPEGIWQTVYNGAGWETAVGEDRYRRMVYTYMKRSAPYPNMLTFDSPSREFCVVRRIRTNTPLQALATLNDTTYIEAAQNIAKTVVASSKDPKLQISMAYKMAMLKDPNSKSLDILLALYHKSKEYYAKNKDKAYPMAGTKDNALILAPLTLVANAILNTDEFITKN